jgi:hypothetical protein
MEHEEDYDETKSVRSTCRSLNIQFKTAQKFSSRDAAKATHSLKETKTERKATDNTGPFGDKVLLGLNLVPKKPQRPNVLDIFIVSITNFPFDVC